jgi:hypothetical protein
MVTSILFCRIATALKMAPALLVVPAFQSVFIMTAVVGGGVLFHELSNLSPGTCECSCECLALFQSPPVYLLDVSGSLASFFIGLGIMLVRGGYSCKKILLIWPAWPGCIAWSLKRKSHYESSSRYSINLFPPSSDWHLHSLLPRHCIQTAIQVLYRR